MPVHKVGEGFKWGQSGKLYKGPGAKAKAEKQAAAIFASGYHGDVRNGHEECEDNPVDMYSSKRV